ncbi:MAG TPA: Spy/CpxP family protein refolding chaperone [Acidocella sp.]|jgi:Spy/CpxP family protein refolding chaperone|uniref:Spy/CpxP family protein refolding chaperone n=1 Tax=Acidocella sp. TaxID=50710 RepID=UPI002B79C44F|nr:Spy/CpxP family protein refolding chaperone [Acidocella sp.]HVE22067.1 Spy/CpxP family protein refolding chaperone [Acidocella sp.]
MRLTKMGCSAVLALMVALLGTTGVQAVSVPTTQAAVPAWQAYFKANSLGFPQIFRTHHPGPGWILARKSQLHLTPTQVTAEQKLAAGMVAAAQASVTRLQAAYAKYHADAAMASPVQETIIADVEAVGRAETRAGLAMVPYHLRAYALLTPEQKATFAELLASPAPP